MYLTEPVDEYTIQSMPEFEGKKFQNVAKEGLKLNKGEKAKEALEQLEKTFDPLIDWLRDKGLKNKIEKAVISERLTKSPSALVASSYGWSGNMERIMKSQAYGKINSIDFKYLVQPKQKTRHKISTQTKRRSSKSIQDIRSLKSC